MFNHLLQKISLILPFQVSNTATLAYFAHFEDELIISITLDNLNCPRQHEFLATAVVKQHKQRTQCSSVGMKYLKIIKIFGRVLQSDGKMLQICMDHKFLGLPRRVNAHFAVRNDSNGRDIGLCLLWQAALLS